LKFVTIDSNELKRLIKLNGHTQTSVAQQVGVSSSYLINVVSGSKSPGAKVATKISQMLGKEVTEIFELK